MHKLKKISIDSPDKHARVFYAHIFLIIYYLKMRDQKDKHSSLLQRKRLCKIDSLCNKRLIDMMRSGSWVMYFT